MTSTLQGLFHWDFDLKQIPNVAALPLESVSVFVCLIICWLFDCLFYMAAAYCYDRVLLYIARLR